jgi:hypothetical protein
VSTSSRCTLAPDQTTTGTGNLCQSLLHAPSTNQTALALQSAVERHSRCAYRGARSDAPFNGSLVEPSGRTLFRPCSAPTCREILPLGQSSQSMATSQYASGNQMAMVDDGLHQHPASSSVARETWIQLGRPSRVSAVCLFGFGIDSNCLTRAVSPPTKRMRLADWAKKLVDCPFHVFRWIAAGLADGTGQHVCLNQETNNCQRTCQG